MAAGAAALALLLDLGGLFFDRPALWLWGGRFALVTIAAALGATLFAGPRGRVFWLCALVLLALARWLRGSAGVAPDMPLVALQVIATLLILWRTRRQLYLEKTPD